MKNEEKMEVFLDLARKLNKKFSVIPLLYGSLGLKMLLHNDLNPDDIDIAVPQYLYRFDERWNDLLSFMLNEGYVLMDLKEHFFQKGEIGVNFSAIDGVGGIPSLEVFVDIDIRDIPIMETDGAFYKLMTLEQYLKVYSHSLEDSYRADNSGHEDQNKIDLLKKALKCTE
ncbi:MAG: hypothetical protein E7256_14145 [Lachnospiraceae bacterium]|nr:hypothetical protein [Lachnospiraceae bacterium]